ncbi:YraN family protein [Flexithrix dorotheae]|uniref:YraN family protein n=1 Tax=Flexithrix dorotheae TaxID=70993 RepID=UPI000371F5CD|nr:YraN family protein [Flexithrix dorotheae]
MNHLEFGKKGEDLAVKFLLEKKYKILDRNFRHKRGEIDIIAEKGNFVVFFEVKTRSNTKFGNPEEAVDLKKEKLIKETAEYFLSKKTKIHFIRFDIIAITKTNHNFDLLHLKDVF